MFHLCRPTPRQLDALCRAQADLPFSYAAVGATRAGELPTAGVPGFTVDRYGAVLGAGPEAFERARAAVEAFAMYPPGWTAVHFDGARRIAEGAVFATVVRHVGFYSALPCRIVYTVGDDGPVRRFGFALGTLPGHAESGEERFCVSWHPDSDAVRYDVLAFSRPRAWPARLASPVARALQKRFARHSRRNMARVVAG